VEMKMAKSSDSEAQGACKYGALGKCPPHGSLRLALSLR